MKQLDLKIEDGFDGTAVYTPGDRAGTVRGTGLGQGWLHSVAGPPCDSLSEHSLTTIRTLHRNAVRELLLFLLGFSAVLSFDLLCFVGLLLVLSAVLWQCL